MTFIVLVIACGRHGDSSGSRDDSSSAVDDSAGCDEQTFWTDADGDGYGAAELPVSACDRPAGASDNDDDCDDARATAHPGASEECNGEDDDCDGKSDVGTTGTWYVDDDGDGYGDDATATKTCEPDPSWVEVGGDCDVTNGEVHPGAVEVCNTFDDDCDGETLACGYAGDFLLADAPTKLTGNNSDDAGRLVEGADLDGDGDQEIAVATLYANSYGGGGYIVDGPPPLGDASLDDVGVTIRGSSGTLGGGRSMGVADTNGDGLDDVGFGAAWSPGGDDVFVIYGPITADMDLVDADVDLQGPDGSYTGHGSDLGDVTGDGIGDAVIGAYAEAGNRGVVYVMNGPLSGTYDLEAEADATLSGDEVNEWTGRVIRCGGDVDGDGVGDLLAPAPYASTGGPYSGKVFVVLGPASGEAELADVSYAQLVGEGANAIAGNDVAMADMDGDGLADPIVGAPGVASSKGHVSWVSGARSGEIDLADADGTLEGASSGMDLGMNVDAKDTDGDGRAEILVSATGVSGDRGEVFLFYGPIVGVLDTGDATATFTGERMGDFAGQGVAFADVDGDAVTDLVVGAPTERSGGSGAGAVYVLSPD